MNRIIPILVLLLSSPFSFAEVFQKDAERNFSPEAYESLTNKANEDGTITVFIHLVDFRKYKEHMRNGSDKAAQMQLQAGQNRQAILKALKKKDVINVQDTDLRYPNMTLTIKLPALFGIMKTPHVAAVETIEYMIPHSSTVTPSHASTLHGVPGVGGAIANLAGGLGVKIGIIDLGIDVSTMVTQGTTIAQLDRGNERCISILVDPSDEDDCVQASGSGAADLVEYASMPWSRNHHGDVTTVMAYWGAPLAQLVHVRIGHKITQASVCINILGYSGAPCHAATSNEIVAAAEYLDDEVDIIVITAGSGAVSAVDCNTVVAQRIAQM